MPRGSARDFKSEEIRDMSYKKQEPILILVSITIFWFLLVSTIPAYAYLDPGSGSMLLQVLLGGVAALAVILKFYWNRFRSLFRRDKKSKEGTKLDQF
jgi:hypothetical protein